MSARSGLNLAIPDQGRGASVPMPGWKPAGRGGGRLAKADPRGASRTCPERGRTDAGDRPSRAGFRCLGCGCGGGADHEGALSVLAAGQAAIV
ncbi:MAG: hypothetical protein LBG06_01535 [Deltaproteobacteria bacterium]|nr:hypothetical protein [Deltaproteobacteria bacterium]